MIPEKIVTDFLKENVPNLMGVYLFGSHANGTARSGSDIDLAYLTKSPQHRPPIENFHLIVKLGGILGDSVDLIDLHTAPTDFRFIIISTGKRIFCHDQTFCDTFEMTTYSMYQRLELERQPIVQVIKKRGTVYG